MRKEELIAHRKRLLNEISQYENLQSAAKVKLNSCYGAL